ncbi:MAG: fimbrillin family protein [Tannerellaceae bacterium]|nr:fimbrillin family protein [Tannerellaceae bacterium]
MRIYYLISILFAAFLFVGCGNDEELARQESAGEDSRLIRLSGSGVEAILDTRAASDFPNGQQIGVVAAEYNNGNTPDWTGYTDIQNALAVTNAEENGTFYFHLSPVQYWPFDGSELVFLGYSPRANGTSVTLESSFTALDIQLVEDMQDVLYASNNNVAATSPYSKTDSIVDLGEFQHVLSQVTLEVVAGTPMNPAIRLDSLIVETTRTTATLDLINGDLAIDPPAGETVRYELVTTSTAFHTAPYSKDILMFAGNELYTRVYVRFSDGPFFVRGWYNVSDFVNIETDANDLVFRRAENTTLRFTVVSTPVDQPETAIHLQGQLTDWNQRQDLTVTIQ